MPAHYAPFGAGEVAVKKAPVRALSTTSMDRFGGGHFAPGGPHDGGGNSPVKTMDHTGKSGRDTYVPWINTTGYRSIFPYVVYRADRKTMGVPCTDWGRAALRASTMAPAR